MTTTYTAICERAAGWWEITVPELESGRVTQAKSLDDVEETVRDLVVLITDAAPEDVIVDVRAPARPPHHSDDALSRLAAVGGKLMALRRLLTRAVDHHPR